MRSIGVLAAWVLSCAVAAAANEPTLNRALTSRAPDPGITGDPCGPYVDLPENTVVAPSPGPTGWYNVDSPTWSYTVAAVRGAAGLLTQRPLACQAANAYAQSSATDAGVLVIDQGSGAQRQYLDVSALPASAEWTRALDYLPINAPVGFHFISGDLVQAYRVWLEPGGRYYFDYKSFGGAGLNYYLFQSPNPFPEWMSSTRPDLFPGLKLSSVNGSPGGITGNGIYCLVLANASASNRNAELTIRSAPGPLTHCEDSNGNGTIGVFADSMGASACIYTPMRRGFAYVIARLDGQSASGMISAEFRLELSHPADYQVDFHPSALVSSITGNPIDTTPGVADASGATLFLNSCKGSLHGDRVLLGMLAIFNVGGPETLEIRTMAKDPAANPAMDAPLVRGCPPNFTAVLLTPTESQLGHEPVASRSFVNPFNCTPCDGHPVDVATPGAPTHLDIRNFPDPFNPTTELRYEVPRDGRVEVAIYDVRGRCVRQLLNEREDAGRHVARWDGKLADGSPARSGIYFARLTTSDGVVTDRLTLLK